MSLPGTEVQRIVERGSRAAQRLADLTGAELQSAHGATLSALDRRGNALLQLARHYLPKLDESVIASSFDGVRDQLQDVQRRRDARAASLRASIDSATRASLELEEQLVTITRELEAKVTRRGELEAGAAALLQADPVFVALANESAQAEARLERDEERAAQLARDAADKLPAYERSRLFRYLHDRGFGTPAYRPRGLVRSIDRWVARLIDFDAARPGYEFLRTMPALVAAEVERRRAEFATTTRSIDEMRDAASERNGLTALIEDGTRIGTERDRLVDALDTAHQQAAAARSELAELDAQRGGFHSEALQRLRDHLDRLGAAELAAHASSTPDAVDDRIVAELAAAASEAERLQQHTQHLTAQRQAAEHRAGALLELVHRMRQAEFDSMRSRFDGFAAADLERRVQRIADGADAPETLWAELLARQRFEQAGQPDAQLGAIWPPDPRGGRPQHVAPSGGVPWWVATALGAVVDIALEGASRRAVTRHGGGSMFGGGLGSGSGRRSSGGATHGSNSGGGSARSSAGSSRSSGGGFTRGSGF